MKRILLSVLAVFFLACATEEGSFEWALNLVEDNVHEWEPEAHLSHFAGVVDGTNVDSDGLLTEDGSWSLTFTNPNEDECRTWYVNYDGKVGLDDRLDEFVKPGPEIVYDNERILLLIKSGVGMPLDYGFTVLSAEHEDPSLYPGHVCAYVVFYDKHRNPRYNNVVDTKNCDRSGDYEILDWWQ